MKHFFKPLILFLLMLPVLALAPDSNAQLKKFYDPQKVVTVQGQIEKLETITRQGRQATNSRKTQIAHLKTDQGTVVVHLGPAEFFGPAAIPAQDRGCPGSNGRQSQHPPGRSSFG